MSETSSLATDEGRAAEDSRPAAVPTLLGVVAIIIWSTTVAFSRRLTESLGIFTASGGVYLIGGSLSLAVVAARRQGLSRMFALPRLYLLVCGSLFVLYTAMLYLAIGLAADRTQTITVGIINYLWPSFVILLSVPILGRRARWTLWPGVAAALAGVVLAELPAGNPSPASWLAQLQANPLPCLFAFVGAVTWGVYSNLSHRFSRPGQANPVPLFLAAAGVVLLAIRLFVHERSQWTPLAAIDLLYMGVFPAMLGYLFYDIAIRRGRIVLVASLAYFIPLLSTLVSCLVLGEQMRPTFWLACGLLIAGAAVCNWSVRD